jgi:hypothetical protein
VASGHDHRWILKRNPARAGWGSKINWLLIGGALSDESDGKILNPHGVEIDLPFWVIKRRTNVVWILPNKEVSPADPGTSG